MARPTENSSQKMQNHVTMQNYNDTKISNSVCAMLTIALPFTVYTLVTGSP